MEEFPFSELELGASSCALDLQLSHLLPVPLGSERGPYLNLADGK